VEVVAEVVVVAEVTVVTAMVVGDAMTDMIAMITDQDHLIGGFFCCLNLNLSPTFVTFFSESNGLRIAFIQG